MNTAKKIPQEERFPKKFGNYLAFERLAESFLSDVYLGIPVSAQKSEDAVVIKSLHRRNLKSEVDRRRFMREMQVTRGLESPHIVKILDYGDSYGVPYIVMEQVRGKTLRELLTHCAGTLPHSVTCDIMLKIAMGMSVAHNQISPIIHRDLSPSNIIVEYNGNVKIIDFGIAKYVMDENETVTTSIIGKPSYMSPEQASGSRLDVQSDIFSMGIIFFEILTQTRPFTGENELVIMEKIRNCDTFFPGWGEHEKSIPIEIRKVVEKCLKRQAKDRYQVVDDVIERLIVLINLSGMPEVTVSQYMQNIFRKEELTDKERNVKIYTKLKSIPDPAAIDESEPEQFDDTVVNTSYEVDQSSPRVLPVEIEKNVRYNNTDRRAPQKKRSISVLQDSDNSGQNSTKIDRKVTHKTSKFDTRTRLLILLLASIIVASTVHILEYLLTAEKILSTHYDLTLKIYPRGGATTKIQLGNLSVEGDSVNMRGLKGQPLDVIIYKPGYKKYAYEIQTQKNSEDVLIETVVLTPRVSGTIQFARDSHGAIVVLGENEKWVLGSSTKSVQLPPGTYKIIFRGNIAQSDIEYRLTIDAGEIKVVGDTGNE